MEQAASQPLGKARCPDRARMSTLTGAHFEGRIRAADERTLREHLRECAGCSELYERHMLLHSLDPKALAAKAPPLRSLVLYSGGRYPEVMVSNAPGSNRSSR